MPFSNIDALPTAPQRTDDAETFIERADAFVAALPTFRNQFNTFKAELEAAAALIAVAPAYADALLKTIADSSLTPAADRGVYFTSSSVAALFTLTSFGRTLAALADATAGRTALGLGSSAVLSTSDVEELARDALGAALAAGAGVSITPDDGSNTITIAATAGVQTGTVISVAMNSAPTGYLKCNGAAVSRTTYAALFAAISTTFGVGDGSTTFNLPDLRGEFVRGWVDDGSVDSGRAFGSTQADELEAHSHFTVSNTTANNDPLTNAEAIALLDDAGGDRDYELSGNSASATLGITSSMGGAETRPRNIALLYCIKT
jgi:microcystin-dependent protein